MPKQPKPITPERFAEVKARHQHHWTFLGKTEGSNPKMVFCRCELCEFDYWVHWRWIDEGKTKRCKGCSRKPDFKILNEELRRRRSKNHLTGNSKKGTKGKRLYEVLCTACNNHRWITLDSVHKTKTGCMSCAQRFWQTRSYQPNPAKKALKRAWKQIHDQKDHSTPAVIEFQNFTHFQEWAFDIGFKKGMRLIRKEKKCSYSEENCYFTDRKRSKQSLTSVAAGLPSGVTQSSLSSGQSKEPSLDQNHFSEVQKDRQAV